MAPILPEKLTEWYDQSGHEYLELIGRPLLIILCYVFMSIVIWKVFILICLFVRFLRFMFGRRIAPDGRKVVIVTGATSGFGLGISKRLFKLGFTVIACYYNDQEAGYSELLDIQIENTERKKKKSPNNGELASLYLVRMDIRSRESIQHAVKEIETILNTDHLTLHCLLNNAGVAIDGPFELMTHESIRNIIDTNLTGAISVARQLVHRIIKDKGRILNVASGMAKFQCRRWALYCATKAATKVFSDSLDEDLKPYGASCRTVLPGSLILHSNLAFGRMRQLQVAISQLSEQEKITYAESIEKATCMANSFIIYKLKDASKEEAEKLAKIYNVHLPDLENSVHFKETKEYKKRWFFERWARRVFRRLCGGYDVDTHLEDTYYMQGYEDAVRMKHPPRYVYVGNRYFHYYMGPLTDYLPQMILLWFNTWVVEMLEETD